MEVKILQTGFERSVIGRGFCKVCPSFVHWILTASLLVRVGSFGERPETQSLRQKLILKFWFFHQKQKGSFLNFITTFPWEGTQEPGILSLLLLESMLYSNYSYDSEVKVLILPYETRISVKFGTPKAQ